MLRTSISFYKVAAIMLMAVHFVYYADAQELSVRLTIRIPSPSQHLVGLSLYAHLWEYDPMLADASATEVDRKHLRGIRLEQGQVSTIPLTLTSKRTQNRRYYVTVFMYSNPDSDLRLYFIDGFKSVFEGKNSEDMTVLLTRTSNMFPLANLDHDGDGVSAEAEMAAGTDPEDALSRFEIVQVDVGAEQVKMTWSSAPEKRYSILAGNKPDELNKIAENIQSEGAFTSFIIDRIEAKSQFYRVVVD